MMAPKHHTTMVMFHHAIDLIMTLVSLTSSLLAVIVSKVIYFIPVIISGVYWFVRMKRDIQTYHEGSYINYLKFLFGRMKRIERKK